MPSHLILNGKDQPSQPIAYASESTERDGEIPQ